ncbi:MAG: ParB/RepB/Spo0J family partition protein [Clostridiales bacterium]|nr:ParB/RepB/Spo0J family partition protein [Clostridiales bacterium]
MASTQRTAAASLQEENVRSNTFFKRRAPQVKSIENNMAVNIPTAYIYPDGNQPRRYFDPKKLDELTRSVKQYGIIQPITVRKVKEDYYVIIAGERRWRAAKACALETVPVMITAHEDESASMVSLIENVQRENLHFYEEAMAYKTLMDKYSLTQEYIASKLGKNQSTVANKLRLLKHSDHVRELVVGYNLTERHARAILALEKEEDKIKAISMIVEDSLNVRDTELMIEEILKGNNREEAAREAEAKKIKKPRIKIARADSRLVLNSIRKVVGDMTGMGMPVKTVEVEVEGSIHYTIIVPKA